MQFIMPLISVIFNLLLQAWTWKCMCGYLMTLFPLWISLLFLEDTKFWNACLIAYIALTVWLLFILLRNYEYFNDSEFTKINIFLTAGHQFMTPKTHNQPHYFLFNANLNGLWNYFLLKEAGISPMTFNTTGALDRF